MDSVCPCFYFVQIGVHKTKQNKGDMNFKEMYRCNQIEGERKKVQMIEQEIERERVRQRQTDRQTDREREQEREKYIYDRERGMICEREKTCFIQ